MSGRDEATLLPAPAARGVLAAWIAAIGIDFLAYGGVFAGLFVDGDPTTLSQSQFFQRIPAGYASFLVEIPMLFWLMRVSSTTESADALQLGGLVGLAFGAALVLGVWSFSPTSLALLLSWWLVLIVQMSFGGWVIASWLAGDRRRARVVLALVVTAVVVGGVLIQNSDRLFGTYAVRSLACNHYSYLSLKFIRMRSLPTPRSCTDGYRSAPTRWLCSVL